MAPRAAKETAGGALETAGRLADVRDKIGAWCAALAAIGGGALLWIGPEEIAEEIPRHREFGAALGALGVVTVFALLLRGSAGYRARSLLLAMVAAAAGAGVGYVLYDAGTKVYRLHEQGEYEQAQVVGQSMSVNPKTGATTTKTKVYVHGKTVSVKLEGRPRRGESAEVLVVPGRPDAIVGGHVEQDWLPLVDALVGKWIALVFALVLASCAFAAPIKLWDALVGPPKGVDPDADAP